VSLNVSPLDDLPCSLDVPLCKTEIIGSQGADVIPCSRWVVTKKPIVLAIHFDVKR
jgi:hypothetical protein